ncbi:MAG TPA: PAS domain S-box protein [Longimicrobiales bacterium]|nr:PAS domain S-box protein [Longimicrobiales bacterium]
MSIEDHRALFESAPDGIVVVDEEGRICRVNPEALRQFGYDEEELVGSSVDRLVPETGRDAHAGHRERYAAAPVRRPMGIGLELQARRKDGSTFPVEISLNRITLDGRPCTMAIVRDVTARRRLQDFSAGALRAAEEVRARIARDLHDDTAQQLAAHMVRLRLLERAESEEERAEHLGLLRDGLEATIDGVRRIARGLRPPELADAGLHAALQAHARRLRESHGLEVQLSVEAPDRRLSADGLLAVYRIIQEALTNVARHAATDRAVVSIHTNKDMIEVDVTDQGRGFRPSQLASGASGLGLMGMQERAVMVGGRLEVVSEPGGGTRVRLSVPVENVPREVERV